MIVLSTLLGSQEEFSLMDGKVANKSQEINGPIALEGKTATVELDTRLFREKPLIHLKQTTMVELH